MKKTNYVAPQTTIIRLHVENIMAAYTSTDGGSGDGGEDASAKGASFWED